MRPEEVKKGQEVLYKLAFEREYKAYRVVDIDRNAEEWDKLTVLIERGNNIIWVSPDELKELS